MGKLDDLIAAGERRWRPSEEDLKKIDAARTLGLEWNDILDALIVDNPDMLMPGNSTLRSMWKNWRDRCRNSTT